MKKTLICSMALGLAVAAGAGNADARRADVETFKAGGVSIAIPPPPGRMVEVGYDNREHMEVFVAPANRLVAAFVTAEDLPHLTTGTDKAIMARYAMVQVPRRGEYIEIGPSQFEELTEGMEKEFGRTIGATRGEIEDELNRRMRSLDIDDAVMKLGEPVPLGSLFSKPNSYGFGMIMPVSVGGESTKMVMGAVFVRVKDRLLFVYNYATYGGEESVASLRKSTEAWADAILAANR